MSAAGVQAPAPPMSLDETTTWHPTRSPGADLSVVGMLLAVATVVRVPYLWDAPRFRDETFNALRALDIYRGRIAPLTDVELYMGSFYNYVVAGVLMIAGPSIYAARAVVTAFGIATVGVAYLLGREVGGRAVELVAAALLLTNGVHIAAVGHVGFSAHVNPFFTTVGFWLLQRAVVRHGDVSLGLAGFFFGMGLHTHPTTIAYLPGAAGWLLWTQGRQLFRRPGLYAALAAFLIAYSPMLIYNVQSGGASIRHALYTAYERPDYALGEDTSLTLVSYLERQNDLIAAVEQIKAERNPTEVVVLDNRLNERRVEDASPWDEESSFRVIRFILEFENIPYEVHDIDETKLGDLVARRESLILVISSGRSNRDTESIRQFIDTFNLYTLDGQTARAPHPDDRYAVMRLDAG